MYVCVSRPFRWSFLAPPKWYCGCAVSVEGHKRNSHRRFRRQSVNSYSARVGHQLSVCVFCRRSVSCLVHGVWEYGIAHLVILSTEKPAAPIFRAEGAIKMGAEFTSKRRHPRRPETLMWMLPPWMFRGGSRRAGGECRGLPPFRIIGSGMYVSYWLYFSYRILFFVIKHVRTTVSVLWIRHCQKPPRFMYSVLYSAQGVWFHSSFLYIYF